MLFTKSAIYPADILILINPGFTLSTFSNIELPDNFSTTSSALINVAFLYAFAAAIAPLH